MMVLQRKICSYLSAIQRAIFSIVLAFIVLASVSCGVVLPQINTQSRPVIKINVNERTSVIPARMGHPNNLMLPDAFGTELLGLGFNVIERSTVAEITHESGNDFSVLINGEQYLRLGKIAKVKYLFIVNSNIKSYVIDADIKLVDTDNGSILWSGTYTQADPDRYLIFDHDSTVDVAKKFAEKLKEIVE